MARCKSCSAPLPANSNRCDYCGIRNDVDLHGKHDFSINSQQSERNCPECNQPLQTIALMFEKAFEIERCSTCYGLFFDPGEIEILLQNTVSGVFDINRQQLSNINKDRYQQQQKFKYVKCPVCQVLMNRVNFGRRSGVIIDQCRKHGVWLNNGEITHLMEWKKAGGQLLHEKHIDTNQEKKRQRYPVSPNAGKPNKLSRPELFREQETDDLIDTVASVIFKLFDNT